MTHSIKISQSSLKLPPNNENHFKKLLYFFSGSDSKRTDHLIRFRFNLKMVDYQQLKNSLYSIGNTLLNFRDRYCYWSFKCCLIVEIIQRLLPSYQNQMLGVSNISNEQSEMLASKDRCSNSTMCGDQEREDCQSVSKLSGFSLQLLQNRKQLFTNVDPQCKISTKLTQRAISFLITIAWTQNYSQECLWTAIQLFYIYRSNVPISKGELETILMACLWMSVKMNEIGQWALKDLLEINGRTIDRSELLVKEAKLFELVQYNLVINHLIEQVAAQPSLSKPSKHKTLFMAELLLLEDYLIFFDTNRMETIVKYACDQTDDGDWTDLIKDLKRILKLKQSKIIETKYSSKFDTDEFIKQLSSL